MRHFLSCDWGTSSFRLRLIEAKTLTILAEQTTDQGIARTFSLWQKYEQQNRTPRATFYLTYVQRKIRQLEDRLSMTLQGIPVIFSGMASSSIGLKELPYSMLPFFTDGRDVPVALLEPVEEFSHPAYLISGIKSEDDVMRGEETQLIGVVSQLEELNGEQLFIFPGTHSKHIWVKNRQVVHFKTYMTGEFFDLLSRKSILSSSLEENQHIENWESFKRGVQVATDSNLLNASFMVRTLNLFGKLNKEQNHDFLSGLLIGTELKELLQKDSMRVYLCCNSHLKLRYEAALLQLGIQGVHVYSGEEIDQAVIRGQFQIYNLIQNT